MLKGMTERSDTGNRVLGIAERHLMRRGYHAFSFGDIAKELGIKPAAIHYYHPTKPDLVNAVIRAYGARFEAWVWATRQDPPADRLAGYFEIGRLVAADGRVCPLSMVVAQQEAIPEEVMAEVRVLHARILDFYVQTLESARAEGTVHFEGSAEEEGMLVACTLIGAQLAARLNGLDVYLRVMRRQARIIGLSEEWPVLRRID